VAQVKAKISVSVDGFVAGPDISREEPLGVGGERLHDWVTVTSSFMETHGGQGGETGVDDDVSREMFEGVGAVVMGRGMFGGTWATGDEWNQWEGWWGDDPPYHMPVYVLTHHAREPLTLTDTTFTFVTDGIERALELARRAAGGKDVALSGGAQAAQQYLNAGLVDEMQLHLVPILLGGGERLFDGVGHAHGLALVETVAARNVVHLKFVRQQEPQPVE
jgi:dihydrofolate reductase